MKAVIAIMFLVLAIQVVQAAPVKQGKKASAQSSREIKAARRIKVFIPHIIVGIGF